MSSFEIFTVSFSIFPLIHFLVFSIQFLRFISLEIYLINSEFYDGHLLFLKIYYFPRTPPVYNMILQIILWLPLCLPLVYSTVQYSYLFVYFFFNFYCCLNLHAWTSLFAAEFSHWGNKRSFLLLSYSIRNKQLSASVAWIKSECHNSDSET